MSALSLVLLATLVPSVLVLGLGFYAHTSAVQAHAQANFRAGSAIDYAEVMIAFREEELHRHLLKRAKSQPEGAVVHAALMA